MLTGRRTDVIQAWSNNQGLAGLVKGGGNGGVVVDSNCVGYYGRGWCEDMARRQNVVRARFVLGHYATVVSYQAYQRRWLSHPCVGVGMKGAWPHPATRVS
jgi:hypothetical protein